MFEHVIHWGLAGIIVFIGSRLNEFMDRGS